jgi:hypothetical protein
MRKFLPIVAAVALLAAFQYQKTNPREGYEVIRLHDGAYALRLPTGELYRSRLDPQLATPQVYNIASWGNCWYRAENFVLPLLLGGAALLLTGKTDS